MMVNLQPSNTENHFLIGIQLAFGCVIEFPWEIFSRLQDYYGTICISYDNTLQEIYKMKVQSSNFSEDSGAKINYS